MKVNKKVVLSTAAVLGVAGLVAGGTIAYFTDYKTDTNSFTVGNVKITLYESQLHRMNSGRAGEFDALDSDPDYCTYTGTNIDGNTSAGPQSNKPYESAKYCTPGMDGHEGDETNISAIANGHSGERTWGFKDSTIKTDAATYKSGYFARVAANIVPGQYVRKFSYVENNGTSDAYVVIRYMVPTDYANNLELEVPSSPYNEGYFTALLKDGNGDYVAYTGAPKQYTGFEEDIDGDSQADYVVYAAVTNQPLKANEMTFWSPVNTVRLKTTAINTDSTDDDYVTPADQIDVKVEAYGIQAKTFTGPVDAINHL